MGFTIGFIGAFIVWCIFSKSMHCPACKGFKVLWRGEDKEHGEVYECMECGHSGWTNYNGLKSKKEMKAFYKQYTN